MLGLSLVFHLPIMILKVIEKYPEWLGRRGVKLEKNNFMWWNASPGHKNFYWSLLEEVVTNYDRWYSRR